MYPIILHDHSTIKRVELENYIFKNFLSRPYRKIPPFTIYPSEIYYELGTQLKIGLTITQIYKALYSNPQYLNSPIDRAQTNSSTLKKIPKSTYADKKEAILKEYLKVTLTNGRKSLILSTNELNNVLDWCVETRSSLYNECPSFALENHLGDFYHADKKRLSKKQGLCDRLQIECILPYCDHLATNDKYMYSTYQYLKKHCGNLSLAKTHKDLKFLNQHNPT